MTYTSFLGVTSLPLVDGVFPMVFQRLITSLLPAVVAAAVDTVVAAALVAC